MGKTSAQKRMKKRLLSALNSSLGKIEQSPYARSIEDGETYICSVCNMRVKACSIHAGAMCGEMIREGTQAWLLEDALRDPDERKHGTCSICGKRISAAVLKKNPTAELCGNCQQKCRHVRQVPGVGA